MTVLVVQRNDGRISLIRPSQTASLDLLIRDAVNTLDYQSHKVIENDQMYLIKEKI